MFKVRFKSDEIWIMNRRKLVIRETSKTYKISITMISQIFILITMNIILYNLIMTMINKL